MILPIVATSVAAGTSVNTDDLEASIAVIAATAADTTVAVTALAASVADDRQFFETNFATATSATNLLVTALRQEVFANDSLNQAQVVAAVTTLATDVADNRQFFETNFAAATSAANSLITALRQEVFANDSLNRALIAAAVIGAA